MVETKLDSHPTGREFFTTQCYCTASFFFTSINGLKNRKKKQNKKQNKTKQTTNQYKNKHSTL